MNNLMTTRSDSILDPRFNGGKDDRVAAIPKFHDSTVWRSI